MDPKGLWLDGDEMTAGGSDTGVALRARNPALRAVSSPVVSELTGRILAARREELGLTKGELAEELAEMPGEDENARAIERWLQRLEKQGGAQQFRRPATRARYLRLLERFGFELQEPTMDALTAEMQSLRGELHALRTLMQRVLDSLDGSA